MKEESKKIFKAFEDVTKEKSKKGYGRGYGR